MKEHTHVIEDEGYEDGIQYVSVMPTRKKSAIVQEIEINTEQSYTNVPSQGTQAPRRRNKRNEKESQDLGEFDKKSRPRYEDIDFEEKAKQEQLDCLYDDEYDDDDGFSSKGKILSILGIIGLVVIIFLVYKTVSLSSELEEANKVAVANEEMAMKYNESQLEILQLEEELLQYRGPSTEGKAPTTPEGGTGESTSPEEVGDENFHTVVAGETIWTIAEAVYGNGADYEKILNINGLKEGENLPIGTKLIIPR